MTPLAESTVGTVLDLRDVDAAKPTFRFVDEGRLDRQYDEIVDGLSAVHAEDPDWWASVPASRNTYVSRIRDAMKTLVVIRRLEDAQELPEEIVVGCNVLKNVIVRGLRDRWRVSAKPETPCERPATGLLAETYRFLGAVRAIAEACALRRRARAADCVRLSRHMPVVLLEGFVTPDSVDGSVFRDPCYPGLRETLNADECAQVMRLPCWSEWRGRAQLLRRLEAAREPILSKEDFLGLGDYVFALLHRVRLSRLVKGSVVFLGFDIAPLFRDELRRYAFGSGTLEALLTYRFMAVAARRGLRLHRVVDWFEGQAIDKCLHLGRARFFPDVATVGYIGFAPRLSFRSIFATRGEHSAGVYPEAVAVTGAAYHPLLAADGGEVDIMTAPAFRARSLPRRRATAGHTVLIVLPARLSEALRLVGAVREIDADTRANALSFVVKPHPTHDRSIIERALAGGEGTDVVIHDGGLEDALGKAAFVVGTGTNALLEAFVRGIPTILFDPSGAFREDPLPSAEAFDGYCRCDTLECIRDFIRRANAAGTADADVQPDRFFEPVEHSGVMALLGLDTK